MKEDFVTHEIAVKLKEKGFDEYCEYGHLLEGGKGILYTPNISQVLKWLRKVKRIDAGAVCDNRDGKWIGYINEMDMPYLVGEYVLHNTYDAYEQAALAGIEYVKTI